MQVASLGDGANSAPFKTDAGWVILQRTGSRQVVAGDENRRAQVRETIGRRKLEDEWNRFLRELRGDAYVDLRTGTPDATAPNGTAPASPAPASPPPATVPAAAAPANGG